MNSVYCESIIMERASRCLADVLSGKHKSTTSTLDTLGTGLRNVSPALAAQSDELSVFRDVVYCKGIIMERESRCSADVLGGKHGFTSTLDILGTDLRNVSPALAAQSDESSVRGDVALIGLSLGRVVATCSGSG